MLSPAARRALDHLATRAVGFERSWSFGSTGTGMAADTGGQFDRRMLLFLPATSQAVEETCRAALALGMTRAGTDAFRRALPEADAIGLGIAQSGSIRLYLQYWDRIAQRVREGDMGNALLYLGIKEYPGGLTRTDRYICRPRAPEALYKPVIRKGLVDFGCPIEAVETLLAPLDAERCIWTVTAGTQRRSWLATVRRADVASEALRATLRPIGTTGTDEILSALSHGTPLHIAGGHDSRKGDFVTFYVSADRTEMTRFLDEVVTG